MNNVMDLIEEYGDFMFKAGYDNVQHDISTEAESYRQRILAALATTPGAEAVDAAEQFEAVDLENHRMRMCVATLMARLTVWLDDDQFNEADGIMYPEFEPLDERSLFEEWMRTKPGHPFARQFANLMWDAWQRRAAMSTTAPAGDAKGEA